MELVKHQIKDANGNPIPFAKAVISNNIGTPLKRNGVTIERIADNLGNLIIPADDGEYMKVSAPGKASAISSATYGSDVVLQNYSHKNSTLFFTNPYYDLLASGIITAAITFVTGMILREIFTND